jgi:hypothetical protein
MKQSAQLKVKNWEQFQHYKDRNPPWIKLHFALLSSEDWVTLDDASKLLAVVCMLIASRNNGMVPNNPAYLKRVAYLDRVPKLKPLIDCGFLEEMQADDSTLQADASGAQADARPETETEEDKKESMSETSSDAAPKKSKRVSYPDAFEAFWKAYPTTVNMSKKEAFDEWKKLDEQDRQACQAGIAGYCAFLKSNPNHPTIHACRFISKRRFEGHAEAQAAPVVDVAVWTKRLNYARSKRIWDSLKWGALPHTPGCLAPATLLQPEDGAGWREWEQAA